MDSGTRASIATRSVILDQEERQQVFRAVELASRRLSLLFRRQLSQWLQFCCQLKPQPFGVAVTNFLVTVFHQLLIFTADSLYGRWPAMEDQSAIIYPDAPWTDPTTLR